MGFPISSSVCPPAYSNWLNLFFIGWPPDQISWGIVHFFVALSFTSAAYSFLTLHSSQWSPCSYSTDHVCCLHCLPFLTDILSRQIDPCSSIFLDICVVWYTEFSFVLGKKEAVTDPSDWMVHSKFFWSMLYVSAQMLFNVDAACHSTGG